MARAKTRQDRDRRKGQRVPSRQSLGENAQLLTTLDLLRERRAPYSAVLRAIIAQTIETFPPAGGVVVEIGAGSGQLLEWLPPAIAARTIHTDPSASALRALSDRHPGSAVQVAEAERLPFEPGAAAAVVGLCVFDAVRDTASAVTEIARVLGRDGRFLHFLDMATLLEAPFAQLARSHMVPIPNVYSDPAEHDWPLDILLLPGNWLRGLLDIARRAGHPLFTGFGTHFQHFLGPSPPSADAMASFKALSSSGERRYALATVLASACQAAVQAGYPPLQALPFHSGRYLLSVLATAFTSASFEIERAEVIARAQWQPASSDPDVRYRSLCLGHQRISHDIPERLLTSEASRIATESAASEQVLTEAGMFVFVARRL